MKNLLFLLSCTLFLGAGCNDTKSTLATDSDTSNDELTLAFYNVENLFDTVDDPDTADEEFTPMGQKQWTEERYQDKLNKLAQVISSLDSELPEVVGLCEVENLKVLKDLVSTGPLAAGGYEIIHKDSPDGRGIDCALLYRKSSIQFDNIDFFTEKLPAGDRPNTRYIVYAVGVKGNDSLHVFVNHWPSRGGGQAETEPNRMTMAYSLKARMDNIRENSANAKIVLMGDFNDHPNDKSVRETLQASGKRDWPMYNFMEIMHKNGEGSYNYKGEWGALDQFIVSQALMDAPKGFSAHEGSAKIYKESYLLYTAPDGNSSPNRTYGKDYYGGYSDHLPVVLQLDFKP
jgi:predicted extracellular nuclease